MQFLQDPIITSTISLTNMNLEYFMGGNILGKHTHPMSLATNGFSSNSLLPIQ